MSTPSRNTCYCSLCNHGNDDVILYASIATIFLCFITPVCSEFRRGQPNLTCVDDAHAVRKLYEKSAGTTEYFYKICSERTYTIRVVLQLYYFYW